MSRRGIAALLSGFEISGLAFGNDDVCAGGSAVVPACAC